MSGKRARRRWNRVDEKIIATLYPDALTEALAIVLGCTPEQLYRKANAMGIKKSEAYLADPTSGRHRPGERRSRATEFKKGHVPANKGLRRPGWSAGRMTETQFKKGEMRGAAQHNYVPIGTERISRDGVLERKVTDDPSIFPARRWVAVQRLVWESANGPIPQGHAVAFKPGTRTTERDAITIDKLELLTRAELMKRNTIHRYPPELKSAIRLVAKLNRKIEATNEEQD